MLKAFDVILDTLLEVSGKILQRALPIFLRNVAEFQDYDRMDLRVRGSRQREEYPISSLGMCVLFHGGKCILCHNRQGERRGL